ncbi:MAG: long-chain-fatty-acid--CoA ligase [Alphaproteobacteria bacterium]|uniref:long-chain-fatty-acid--CoA ligase n=1 Tax=Hyphomonas sp. TaxID=87 RepID=UPI001D890BBB|nr:long-chain-fatty-acid--CoA ligase [Alphaproteobacteria bacterium]MBU2083042.1 long-chain-fatty-acid--CoA ligase [Alphaproteobacteria bacterium]MBU2144659.1 long-chain-fatty-acid--CoA ligase [Alphaproteobacteria bacterium]MBU2195326.1 long-chain-fatty-acid--CoA ligase [Alphaproteobacteria bacterium]
MKGLMQNWPLTVDKILDHANRNYPDREIVSRSVEGPIVTTTYREVYDRSRQLTAALQADGIVLSDRIGTIAWNTARHIECWYGTMGMGAILHTINPRLHPDQIAWLANDANDRILIVDLTFVPIVEQIRDKLHTVEKVIVLCADDDLPESSIELTSYEAWIFGRDTSNVRWGQFDEETACGLCYTSGTTGNPKGVLYSHRSNVLHAFMSLQPDAMNLSGAATVLPVVPMFHANAWGLAFSCLAVGAKLVLPGPRMEPDAIYELLCEHDVTFTAAVPTVWMLLLNHLLENDLDLPALKRVVIGGTAVPERILRTFEEKFGVDVIHAWGMTETSPIGTIGTLPAQLRNAPLDERVAHKLKQGRTPFGVEMKLVDDAGARLPHDGNTPGRVMVRGLAVVGSYFNGSGGNILDGDGFFDTGDIATVDSLGTMQITDRAKDVIKSGGEWISSIDIENIAIGHPEVANAAVIGVYHPKWDERPILIVQPVSGRSPTKDSVLAILEGKIAKWWMPDDVVMVDEIPLGPTGKNNKLALRDQFKDFELST